MKEALKLALDALQKTQSEGYNLPATAISEAITALEAALAQPAQEPVATDWERIARVQNAKLIAMCGEVGGFEKLCEVMDKYKRTTPPQRKPLTDEQIDAVRNETPPSAGIDFDLRCRDFARAIEAAHGIKETTE